MAIPATQVQWRRGNFLQNATFIGATGEICVDTDNSRIIVHDNYTFGGWTGARIYDLNTSINNISGFLVNNYVSFPILSSVSGLLIFNLAATGSYLYNSIVSQANYNSSTYSTISNLYSTGNLNYNITVNTGILLNNKINSTSGYLQNQINSLNSATGYTPPSIIYATGTGQYFVGDNHFYSIDLLPTSQPPFTYGPIFFQGVERIRLQYGFLIDSQSNTSLDWLAHIGNYKYGSNTSINYGLGLLFDSGNSNISIDYNNRIQSGAWNIQSGNINETLSYSTLITSGTFTLSNKPFYVNTGSSISTWKLPQISSTIGTQYIIKNKGASIILTGTYPDNIFSNYKVNNFIINSGESFTVINDGVDWTLN